MEATIRTRLENGLGYGNPPSGLTIESYQALTNTFIYQPRDLKLQIQKFPYV